MCRSLTIIAIFYATFGSIQLSSSDGADTARLQLSGVQKDLEALITMEEGLRSKLTPVLHNMQFEDACRQRLEHLAQGWKSICAHENNPKSDPVELLKTIQDSLSSVAEESLFITEVLEEEPPENMGEDAETILFF